MYESLTLRNFISNQASLKQQLMIISFFYKDVFCNSECGLPVLETMFLVMSNYEIRSDDFILYQ